MRGQESPQNVITVSHKTFIVTKWWENFSFWSIFTETEILSNRIRTPNSSLHFALHFKHQSLLLPTPVPWPSQQCIRVRCQSVMVSCCNANCILKCFPISFPETARRYPSSYLFISLVNLCQSVFPSKNPLRFWFFGKFHLFMPTNPRAIRSLLSRENCWTTDWCSGELQWYSSHWLPSSRNSLFAGAGGIRCRCYPGTPMDGQTPA